MSLTNPIFVFPVLLFISRRLLLDFLYFLSLDESYSLKHYSGGDGSDSGSSGMHSFHAFSLRFDDSVGCVSGLVFDVFIPKGFESKCDIFAFDVFVPI